MSEHSGLDVCPAVTPCLHEEDGTVTIQDDLNALLQVSSEAYLQQRAHLLATLISSNASLPQVLPPDIRSPLEQHRNRAYLLEVYQN